MSAGAYRVPVILEQPVATQLPDGRASLVYASAGTDFIEMTLLSLQEQALNARLEGTATHRIKLRYRPDLTGGWRLKSNERVFRLLAVSDPDGRERELHCMAEEEGV